MKKVTVYTNGISLFTLENYGKTAGVSESNGISFHKEVSKISARAMHSSGTLHYVIGIGDRKVLKGVALKRKQRLGNFDIL